MHEGGREFMYARLADEFEDKIMNGVFRAGEKLPSIRKLHDRTGMSITTVYQAYIELEKRGYVEPRMKSGFYVRPLLRDILPPPESTVFHAAPRKVGINALVNSIIESMSDPSILHLSSSVPSPELLPHKRLFRSVRSGGNSKAHIARYEAPAGLWELRRQIAKRMTGCSVKSPADGIVITNGCMDAVHLCLRAVAKPGDTIVVESPTFSCFLQLIEDLNMLALDVPADCKNGIHLGALQRALDKNDVRACIFISNFHNPLGYCMSPENKQRLVECLNERDIPIIEDDIYGELYFGKTRPPTLKQFDRKGLVLYCSSFSKTLAPGLRVGWTIPGKFRSAVERFRLNTSIASPSLNQEIISDYLKSGSYERHLRKLRSALRNQMSDTALAVARYFPKGTRMTAPEGGISLWIQLDESVDGLDVYHEAKKRKISIAPGVLCSNSKNYRNFIRVSCGHPWSEEIENAISGLGQIIERLKGG